MKPATPAIVRVTYFTDPLCSWSWAFEPVRRQLVDQFGATIAWSYRMGGLVAKWASFHDPINAVHTPAQLAPAWYYVASATGVQIDESIWVEDPPASSYPGCLAIKAAALQGRDCEEQYLSLVRNAVMTRRWNVARTSVLLQLAGELAAIDGRFDARRFERDLHGTAVRVAFAEDIRECRIRNVGRFPTFIVHGPRCSRTAVGYRPYDVFLEVLSAVGLPLSAHVP
jgi:predicted DsbA family dithiol-disulfide isomerase